MSFGVLFTTNTASAQYDDRYAHLDPIANPTPVITSLAKASTNGNITIKGFGFIPTSIVRVNGSDHSVKFIDDRNLLINLSQGDMAQSDPLYISVFNAGPGGGYSNASSMKSSDVYTTPVNTNGNNNSNSSNSNYNRNANTNSNSNNSNNNNSNQNDATDTTSSLASNVIFGSASSLVPSGLIGWILFAILILIIILVVRRIFGFTDAYHSTPLKHD